MINGISKTGQAYEWLVDSHPTGTRFTCHDIMNGVGISQGAASGAIYRMEQCGVVKPVGSKYWRTGGKGCRPTTVYEYVSHEPMRFHKGTPGSVRGKHNGKHASPRKFDLLYAPPTTEVPHYEPKLSVRLLRLALALEQQKQLRAAAKKAGAKELPPRATQPMLDKLLDIAMEIERLELRVKELEKG